MRREMDKLELRTRRIRLRRPGHRYCFDHRFDYGDHEAGFALQLNESIRFVDAGRWNRVGARVGSDNGFRGKRLFIGDSRKGNRGN